MARGLAFERPGWKSAALIAFTMSWMLAIVGSWAVAQDPAAPLSPPPVATPATVPALTASALSEVPDGETESFFGWLHRASGVFGYTIFLCSFILVAVILMLFMQLRRDVMLPPAFIETFESRLNNKDFQGAFEAAKGDDSVIARMLAAGMGKLNQGPDKALEEMQVVGDEEYMYIDHKLGYLALIAAIGPMLGLLGTVQGMIVSFEVIARSSTTPKPKDLAVGISMALVTTLEGLVVAIPAMTANALFKNKAQILMNQIGAVSTVLIGRFAVAKPATRPTGGGSPSATPAA